MNGSVPCVRCRSDTGDEGETVADLFLIATTPIPGSETRARPLTSDLVAGGGVRDSVCDRQAGTVRALVATSDQYPSLYSNTAGKPLAAQARFPCLYPGSRRGSWMISH